MIRISLPMGVRDSGRKTFSFSLPLLEELGGSITATVLLCFLINIKLGYKQNRKIYTGNMKDDSEWFRCPAGDVQNMLMMTKTKHMRAMKILRDFNLIATENRHNNTMWISINAPYIKKVMNEMTMNR